MKNNYVAILLILVFCPFAFSQKKGEKPDFSGLWRLDPSYTADFYGSGAPWGEFSKLLLSKIPNCEENILKIEHVEPQLKLAEFCRNKIDTDVPTEDFTKANIPMYFTDGRGEKNAWVEGGLIDSITKWDGNKIVTT